MLPPIQLTGHHVEITQTIRDFVKDKFDRLKKHNEVITSIHVVLSVDKLRQMAEAKLHVPHAEVFATAESEDMYKTIDILVDKLVRQLEKHRGKNSDHRRQ